MEGLRLMANILVVEDEPSIQTLISLNLEHAGFSVTLASSAEEGERSIKQVLPDAVILDWMLPVQSGVALAKKLRSDDRTRDLPILMLTARIHEDDKILGLEVGADDYITKPFSPKELVARIRAVLRRRTPHLSEDIIEMGLLTINPATHRAQCGETTIEMGPTEFRLLLFFVTHPERVYTRTQLLNEVWGDHVFIEERTIDVHIRRLRSALEACQYQDMIETVRGTGYRCRKI